jgi:hypothetical protein
MKISWGYRIFFIYTVFVAGILFLVYKANQQKFDLVTEDYYGEELKYQNVINEKSNVSQLSSSPVITHSVDKVNITLPAEFSNSAISGEVYLYRPSDASKDTRQSFSVNGNIISIPLPSSLSGAYELKLSWKAGGKSFFNEQKIFF